MKRLLGTNEQFLWLRNQRWSVNFNLTVRIKGSIDQQQLTDALTSVQHRHPLLQVKIELNDRTQPQFISVEGSNIPLKILKRQTENHWCEEAAREIVTPFSENKAPLLRVVWLKNEHISDLIFTCHHAIGDALSVVYVIQEVLQKLGSQKIDRPILPERPPLEKLIPSLKLNNTAKPAISRSAIAQTTQPTWQPSILHWQLSSEETKKLISSCRQQKVSIHGAICSAFLLAITEIEHLETPTNLNCLSPLNARNYLIPNIGSDFGVYIALPITNHKIDPQTNFWELAKQVKHQLTETVSTGQLFANIPPLQSWLATNPDPEEVYQQLLKKDLHLAISNLGRLDIPQQYGHLTLEAIYGPTLLGVENVRVIGITTLADKMFCTFTYLESVIPQTIAQKTQTRAIQILHQAIAPT